MARRGYELLGWVASSFFRRSSECGLWQCSWRKTSGRLMASTHPVEKCFPCAMPSSYKLSPGFSTVHPNSTSRQYVVNVGATSTILVDEVMAESVASRIVPMKLLEAWMTELTAVRKIIITPLQSSGSWTCEIETENAEEFLKGLDAAISFMQCNLDALRESSSTFKRSSEKTHPDKAFLPINLHLQSVTIRTGQPTRHDVTTVGAFTAMHTLAGQCGLESLWRSYPDRTTLPVHPQSNGILDESAFVGYPVVLRKFKTALTVAAALSNFDNETRMTCPALSLTGRTLVALLNDLYQTVSEEPLVADPLREIIAELSLHLNHNDLQKKSDISRKVSRAVRQSILHILRSATADIAALFLRECVVMSQMISATVSALLTAFYGGDRQMDVASIGRIRQQGLLVCFESLLSCWMDERVMLEDMIGGLEVLQEVTFVLPFTDSVTPLNPAQDIRVASLESGRMEVRLPSYPRERKSLNDTERERGSLSDTTADSELRFHIFPVLLNVGINEVASLAARQGKIELQKESNKYYGRRLLAYTAASLTKDSEFDKIHAEFEEQMSSTVAKNIGLLHTAQALTRMGDGLRFTMCKSAKDRTAMAVTHEQATQVKNSLAGGLAVAEYDRLLTDMRRNGTRRENTVKNIGFARYAFIREQVEQLPPIYQPPPGTFGKSET